MNDRSILHPLCAMVALTCIVWFWMAVRRVSALKKHRIHPQRLASGTDAEAEKVLAQSADQNDNLENLFELPVLFYVAAIVIFVTQATDTFYVGLAWGFVFFRAVHSWIHCTSNRVYRRAQAYGVASLILWIMWARLTWQLIQS